MENWRRSVKNGGFEYLVYRQAPKTSFFAGSAGIMPAFFKKMRASRPRSQGFSELVYNLNNS